jgi:tryptophan synthase beta subunit
LKKGGSVNAGTASLSKTFKKTMKKLPNRSGHFGKYGGRYISETLMPAVLELDEAYRTNTREGPRRFILPRG